MTEKRVLITGASGLLGRSVVASFRKAGWTVIGTALSRVTDGLIRLDICNFDDVQRVFEERKPQFVVHCAAQRFPDKVDGNVEAAMKLNVDATRNLAELSARSGATMIYISSDYVFDGTKPPYTENDEPNPLNNYGKTKLLGEKETLSASPGHISLRIPLLFGSVEYLAESAATVLLELLLQSNPKSISDYEIRYPSHVDDIASICVQLAERKMQDPHSEELGGIYQWGGKEALTKYGMVKCMSEVFGLPMGHISPDPNPVPGAPRPYDARMSSSRLEKLDIGHHTPFRDAIKAALQPWVDGRNKN